METDAERLEKIRACLANASTAYAMDFRGREDPALVAVIVPKTQPEIIARFDRNCPDPDRDIILHSADWLAFMDRLVRAHGRRNAELRARIERLEARDRPKDHAAEVAMKCAEPAFQRFLGELSGLAAPRTKDEADTRVKSLLAITSKTQLKTDPNAVARWKKLRADFENWRNGR